MSTFKKPKKIMLDNKSENVSPPWQAWFHTGKERKFYTNSVTKESIWEHPSTAKSEESPKKSKRAARKRRDDETRRDDCGDDERMEVDAPPPPKRKTVDETESCPSKKWRQSSSVEIAEKPSVNPSTSQQSDKVLPRVPWSSKIRPFNKLQYSACAIFDTCALIEDPSILDNSVEKKVLSIIPYAVLTELDGLKNSDATRRAARSVSTRLKDIQEQKNMYLHVETSVEQKIRIDGYLPDVTIQDDSILNCALRTKQELLSVSYVLKIEEKAIFLVTNDTLLSNKALTHDLTIESVESFIDRIYGRKKKPAKSNKSVSSQLKNLSTDKFEISEHNEARVEIKAEKSYKKAMAVGSVKKKRETQEWLKGMLKPVTDQYCAQTTDSNITPTRSRPTIPLEDEVVSSAPKPTYPKKTYYTSKPQIKKPSELNRSRPQMPLSLSDDETDNADEMDCS
ncbi:unnamed protein product [Caenorhabditis brenneri]